MRVYRLGARYTPKEREKLVPRAAARRTQHMCRMENAPMAPSRDLLFK